MDARGRQLRQDAEFAGKPAGALSRAIVWPARLTGASGSQNRVVGKWGLLRTSIQKQALPGAGLISLSES
ncbi:hypothetical protein D7024_07830 [Desulfofundulus salinus]|uniref:Uncharacterized protein n=1 Tax=Desulfofundulus salinus TaxID=2419843 RepID=A0A494X0Z9_9FIRM|nr:hypothetical protein D7024_07830 [Desulfofundulus salinum]